MVIINENASMNTCENAVFTAKLLSHHELSTTVYLVTDRYHMAPGALSICQGWHPYYTRPCTLAIRSSWQNPKDNLIHTRRTIYELVALARDIITPKQIVVQPMKLVLRRLVPLAVSRNYFNNFLVSPL